MGNLICKKRLQTKLGGVSTMFINRRLVDDPTFPKPIRLAKRQLFWREDEVDAWIERRAALTAARKREACPAQIGGAA